jgi:putative drug exporter of the RND superfamily
MGILHRKGAEYSRGEQVAWFAYRWAVPVVLSWVAVAGLANVAVPQLEGVVSAHSRSFLPATTLSQAAAERSAELFGIRSGDNVNYVVLERDQPLQPGDRRFYDALMTALRADARHVGAVTDLWSLSLTAVAAQSQDRAAVNVMVQLSGELGTAAGSASVGAVRATVARLGPPRGLHVYVAGPGATRRGRASHQRIRICRKPDVDSVIHLMNLRINTETHRR